MQNYRGHFFSVLNQCLNNFHKRVLGENELLQGNYLEKSSNLFGLNFKIVFLVNYFESCNGFLVGFKCQTWNGLWMEVGRSSLDGWLQGCHLSLALYWQGLLLQRQILFYWADTMLSGYSKHIPHVWGWNVSSCTLSWRWKVLPMTLERKSSFGPPRACLTLSFA